MRYPLELNQTDVDYVTFTHHKYASNASGVNPPAEGGGIILYMPTTTPSVSQQGDWGEQNFEGPLGALRRDAGVALANTAMDADLSSVEAGQKSGKMAADRFKEMFNKAKASGGGAIRQLGVTASAGIAGTSPNQLLALSRGQIYNPNVELLYKGPKIRSFTFNYTFVPKSAGEARSVNSIIKEFKMYSAPEESGDGMFEIPHVWQVTYMAGGGPNPNMNLFKRAALTNVAVQANSGMSMHMSHQDGQPIVYTMSLNFTEVDLVLRKDHQAGNVGF